VQITGELDLLSAPRFLLFGNGGSASIASHIANDILKMWERPAFVMDAATMSCLGNDFGWERVFEIWLERAQRTEDCVIAISSSGASKNVVRGCLHAREHGPLVTLTGFEPNNPVRETGHLNFYVPSKNYGIVETVHLAILHSIFNPGLING